MPKTSKQVNRTNKVLQETHALFFLTVAALSVFSCTKKLDYEPVAPALKEYVSTKSLVDENADYIYSASQQNSSMSAAGAFPYFSGENKRVRVKLAKNAMQIIEMERDERYASNEANNKLVLEIPIDHVQFECARDAYNECTNREEDNSKLSWEQKKDFRFKFDQMKNAQLDFLPVLDSATFGENCYQEVAEPKVTYAKVEADAMNFQIERTFKTNIDCLHDVEEIKDATFSATYHYSLVKTSSVLSQDYEVVNYPESSKDEQSFGFFATKSMKRDVDHNVLVGSYNQIMNRWNPNRSEINYYLSESFNKPKNQKIKELTYKTVDSLNAGLKFSGTKFQIKLHDYEEGKLAGDIRNSMIVLVDDPVASSVIGYGPQTEDPVTGEIISARTIMFLGTIESFVQTTYADIIRAKKEQKALTARKNKNAVSYDLSDELKYKVNNAKAVFGAQGVSKVMAAVNVSAQQSVQAVNNQAVTQNIQSEQIIKDLRQYTRRNNNEYSARDIKTKFKYLNEVKNCAYSPSSNASIGEISKKLMAQFKDNAKPWHLLSASEKQNVMDIILPEIWVSTLIHEIGHNLGLRHNFEASEDKDNFYSDDELKNIGLDRKAPFSSVMDYGDDLKALPVLGKYDIAALRFGYARQVEVVDKEGKVSLAKVKTTLQDLKLAKDSELKNYGYCTDEHTGINAGCRRFDLGTTYTEIVQNLIKQYEASYELRNMKNGRANFSMMDDLTYGRRIKNTFMSIRTMAEVKERLQKRFHLADNDPVWDQYDWLKDLKQATVLGGAFMAKVLLTPDTTCALALTTKPNEIVQLVNLKDIDSDAISCFELSTLKNSAGNEFKVVAQTGKTYLSKKAKDNPSSYVDQIDVRGIWPDKIAALQTLFDRKTGVYTFDEHRDTYLNVPELRNQLMSIAQLILNDGVVDTAPFTLADGSVVDLEIPVELSSSQEIPEHMYKSALDRSLGGRNYWENVLAPMYELNVSGKTTLQEIVASVVARGAVEVNGTREEDRPLKAAFSVYAKPVIENDTNYHSSVLKMPIDDKMYIASNDNVIARSLMSNITMVSKFEKMGSRKVYEIYLAKQQGERPPQYTPAYEKEIWALDNKTLEAYLLGNIKESAYYKNVLKGLPWM